jgi:two-component system LytT family response regulator
LSFLSLKVTFERSLEKLMLDEILYIEGMGNYRMIHTVTQKIMTLQTFTDFEQELPPSLLCRVHKSYMVTSAKIDSAVIPISDSY